MNCQQKTLFNPTKTEFVNLFLSFGEDLNDSESGSLVITFEQSKSRQKPRTR